MSTQSKTVLASTRGWTPVIDSLVRKYSPITALVFGIIWRYCQLENGECTASQTTLAQKIGLKRKSVLEHAKILVNDGYLEVIQKGNRVYYRDTGKVSMLARIEARDTSEDEIVPETDNPALGCVPETDNQEGVSVDEIQPTVRERDTKKLETKPVDNRHYQQVTPQKINSPPDFTISAYPEELRGLAGAFISKFGRTANSRSEHSFWIGAFREMLTMGITEKELITSFGDMDKDGLTIKSPKSLVGMAYNLRRKSKKPERVIHASEVW